jgi:tRNA(adenine34) deaminase
MNEYYMKIAFKLAKKALKYNEVPVGAIIVKNNKIIAKAYNKKEKTHDVTKHAEIIAISKACRKLKNWRLENCEMYVTMEPCMMCSGAIEQSRLKKIVYGVKNENYGCIHNLKNIEIISQVCENECKKLVQSFFKKRR